MAKHSSARKRQGIPHVTNTNKLTPNATINGSSTKKKRLNLEGTAKKTGGSTKKANGIFKKPITNVLKRRARAVITDRTIDAQSRVLVRYALEISDPWLPELVRRVDAGEPILRGGRLQANP